MDSHGTPDLQALDDNIVILRPLCTVLFDRGQHAGCIFYHTGHFLSESVVALHLYLFDEGLNQNERLLPGLLYSHFTGRSFQFVELQGFVGGIQCFLFASAYRALETFDLGECLQNLMGSCVERYLRDSFHGAVFDKTMTHYMARWKRQELLTVGGNECSDFLKLLNCTSAYLEAVRVDRVSGDDGYAASVWVADRLNEGKRTLKCVKM